MNIQLTELHTLRDWLRYATTRFNQGGLYFGHGTDNAWDEACALIFHTLNLPHSLYATVLDAHLTSLEKSKLAELIELRITKKIPVPYITHEAWFNGLSFYVDERVLIPRSPLAELIENEFSPWVDPDAVETILDLCTGSACIAIACAKTFPHAQVDASDISSDALAVAKTNILRHEVDDQVTLYPSNLFEQLPHKKYDIIISNPPYVDGKDMAALPPEYLHEPTLGLKAGDDGLLFAEKILQDAKHYLKDQGVLIVEVGNSQQALMEKYPNLPFTWLEFQRGGGGVFLLTAEQLG